MLATFSVADGEPVVADEPVNEALAYLVVAEVVPPEIPVTAIIPEPESFPVVPPMPEKLAVKCLVVAEAVPPVTPVTTLAVDELPREAAV